MNQFRIRLALVSDLPAISAIEDNSFPTPYPASLLERLLEDCPESFFVATNHVEKLIGYCVCSLSRESAHLISIAVQNEYRRRRVATKLLNRAIEFLVEQSILELWLEVNLKNVEAVSLYSKMGFEKIAVLKGYYSDGSDAIKMRLIMKESRKAFNGGS